MLSERILSKVVGVMNDRYLDLKKTNLVQYPAPKPGLDYMLYMHVPFCERLCPYCSFNRYPFSESRAVPYFESLRKEMHMLKDAGYDFKSVYVGGGTPTIMIDELCETIDQARSLFSIEEVSSEMNPNHLIPAYIEKLAPRVQRLSVGVQSFDDGILEQMDRYDKYGSGVEIIERLQSVEGMFDNLNIDMMFNLPSQTEEILRHDLECIKQVKASQTTFYPIMASPVVARKLRETVGKVDYRREHEFYQIIDETLTGGPAPSFTHGSAWTFNSKEMSMIDEYVVDYEEYPAIGSGGLTYLDGSLYVNTFSLSEYGERIAAGQMSVMGRHEFTAKDRMRYRFMMSLFGMRLDKRRFEEDFGISVEKGLPLETMFMKRVGAYATDDDFEITLTPKGRYLLVVMMRQFFIGVNSVRDKARAALTGEERQLIFG
jgi:menaquinone C8-methyltransferase